ncbi:MAG: BMC domain-containing protein [Candidatus Latescibacteria bacterium]|nr:BMC domain-containing protein [Candidatus Latescibacterota bacterium]
MSSPALGILETRGMAALVGAADVMVKAAQVEICGRHGVGSAWVTVLVEGEVAAVEAALRAGQEEAAKYGELISAEVIARPEGLEGMPHRTGSQDRPVGNQALGLLETRGLTPLIGGADAMAKAAAVSIEGWAAIGGALVHVIARGDVAAVQTALEAGRLAAAQCGDVIATLLIPQPASGLGRMLPPPPAGEARSSGALGVIETTGYVAMVGAGDAAVKSGEVEISRINIGTGGRVALLFKGNIDDVQAAVDAGTAAARQVGELNAARLVSRPAPEVMACFAAPGPSVERPSAGRALGLIETRSSIALAKAMDLMLKAANVEYEGSYKVGYFLTASAIRGDVAAVQAALDAGAVEAAKYGELVAIHLIPHPYTQLTERLVH